MSPPDRPTENRPIVSRLRAFVRRTGRPPDSSPPPEDEQAGDAWVEVIVKLRDPAVEVPGLVVRTAAGPIVTGRARQRDLERIRSHENVISLETSSPIAGLGGAGG